MIGRPDLRRGGRRRREPLPKSPAAALAAEGV